MFGLTDGVRDSSGIVPNGCLGLDLVAHVLTERLDASAELASMFGERIGRYTARPLWYAGELPALFVYPFFSDPDYVPGTAERSEFLFVIGVGYQVKQSPLDDFEASPLTAAAMVKRVLWSNKNLVDEVNDDTQTRLIQGFKVQRENPVFVEGAAGRPSMVIHEIPWLVDVCLNPATGQIESVEQALSA